MPTERTTSHPSSSMDPGPASSMRGLASGLISVPRFCALIIGINEYESNHILNLRGCVADADNVYRYLTEDRGESAVGIVKLYNKDATRAKITEHIDKLKNSPIEVGTPIVIFWAGHGARHNAPNPDWNGDNYIQMLLTHDCDLASTNGDENKKPILDYEFGGMISELARAKGDNITIILDTCCAGSGTRWDDPQVRTINLPEGFALGFDARTVGLDRGQSPGQKSRWGPADLRSHVLLAATSALEPAWEDEGEGVFTRELCKFLRTRTQPDEITYSDVIAGLSLPSDKHKQHPQSDGTNTERYLFRRDSARTYGHRFRAEGDLITLEAGQMQGVVEGMVFDLYADRKHECPLLSNLVTEKPDMHHSTLRLPINSTPAQLPRTGWARQMSAPYHGTTLAGASSPINVDFTPAGWPQTFKRIVAELEQGPSSGLGLRLSPSLSPELFLGKNTASGEFVFDLADPTCLEHRLKRLKHSIKSSREDLREVLTAATGFFGHFRRTGPERPLRDFIKVQAHLLERRSDGHYATTGEELLQGSTILEPRYVYREEKPGGQKVPGKRGYGFHIKNESGYQLYVWIFAFNMNDLSIDLIRPPSLAKEQADYCVAPQGVLTLGYGSGGVRPKLCVVDDGEDVAVTYLKLFLSTSRPNLSRIERASAFLPERKMMDLIEDPPDIWDTFEIAIVQKLASLTHQASTHY